MIYFTLFLPALDVNGGQDSTLKMKVTSFIFLYDIYHNIYHLYVSGQNFDLYSWNKDIKSMTCILHMSI